MHKPELARMQRLAAQSCERCLRAGAELARTRLEARAVSHVAEERVADVGEVHADLVRAPCLERELEEAGDGLDCRPVSLEHRVASDGVPARSLAGDRDFGAIGTAAGERRRDGRLLALGRAPHKCQVMALEVSICPVCRELMCEPGM